MIREAQDRRIQLGQYPDLSRTILSAADAADGYRAISLEKTTATRFSYSPQSVLDQGATRSPFDAAFLADRWQKVIAPTDWNHFRHSCADFAAKRMGVRAQVVDCAEQCSDDCLRLTYDLIEYYEGAAFHDLLSPAADKADLIGWYRERALGVTGFGTQLPNLLSIGVVTLIGLQDELFLVIGLRKRRGTGGQYYPNNWSGVGEQFTPIDQYIFGQFAESDGDRIEQTAARGIREELLSGVSVDFLRTRLQVHALLLEDSINNYAFLGLADLRPLSVRDLWSQWRLSRDRAEHLAIAAIPATLENLEVCLRSDELPKSLWRLMATEGLVTGLPTDGLNDFHHRWSPNMPMQLALALWYVEEVLPKKKGL